jgi:hypothetical protein
VNSWSYLVTMALTLDERPLGAEPSDAKDIAQETITAFLVMGGIAIVVTCVWLAWVLPGFYKTIPAVFGTSGWLLAIRFSRNDRNVAGTVIKLKLENAELKEDLIEAHKQIFKLHTLSQDAQQVVVLDRPGFVRPESQDTSHADAVLLLRLGRGRRLMGWKKSGIPQERQQAALLTLARAGLIREVGQFRDLVCERDEALTRLESFAFHPSDSRVE